MFVVIRHFLRKDKFWNQNVRLRILWISFGRLISSVHFLWSPSLLSGAHLVINPLSTNSDENETSLYIITTRSNIQVMRIKKVITKDKMSLYLDKFSLLVPLEMYGEQ